jgi:hypothetical protein
MLACATYLVVAALATWVAAASVPRAHWTHGVFFAGHAVVAAWVAGQLLREAVNR